MAEMTSRERVVAALNHQEPDRVPLDIGGGGSTSILVEGYERLKAYLGIEAETQAMINAFRIARLDEETMRRLGSDCRPITIHRPDWDLSPAGLDEYRDMWGVTWKRVSYGADSYYWEHAGSPLAEATVSDLDAYAWPDLDNPVFTAGLREEVRSLYEDTDYAIMAESGFKSFWELAYMLAGYERLLMDVVIDPGFVSALLNKLLEINLIMTGRFLDIVGPYIQVFRSGDDLGTQRGPLFSPQAFRTLVQAGLQALLRPCQVEDGRKDLLPQLRQHHRVHRRPGRRRGRHHQPGSGHGDAGHGSAQGPVRQQGDVLGWSRQPARAPRRHSR